MSSTAVDFSAVLDLNDRRCMSHPSQRLISTPQFGGRTFLSCPYCNAGALDRMAREPGTITIRIGKP